jgi:hypothetical protein
MSQSAFADSKTVDKDLAVPVDQRGTLNRMDGLRPIERMRWIIGQEINERPQRLKMAS